MDSTVGHGDPVTEFMARAFSMPWCSQCGGHIIGMRASAEEITRLRSELAEYRQKNALLREALDDAAERMDRARGIIRTPHGVGWAMLDTTTQRAALAAEGENSDV